MYVCMYIYVYVYIYIIYFDLKSKTNYELKPAQFK